MHTHQDFCRLVCVWCTYYHKRKNHHLHEHSLRLFEHYLDAAMDKGWQYSPGCASREIEKDLTGGEIVRSLFFYFRELAPDYWKEDLQGITEQTEFRQVAQR